ncbi:SMI1/KNR4 family protein [Streptomyces sp. CC228A]|uniref:SMI1/KNR4 family protein n=1 Tax=Streptomyces sp. CC228A TaxID=2898186 RepID=UPI001F382E0B|nr:SMI1/KNR4 family protein [Streptomyces sp. CC228A]
MSEDAAEDAAEAADATRSTEARGVSGGRDPLAALVRLMPPLHGADEHVDWAAAERRWGVGFPADYRAFMARYGGGTINGEAVVLLPLPQPGLRWAPADIAEETGNARLVQEQEGGPGLPGGPGGDLLAWGVTAGADILCWLTADPDPDRWPVVVCGRHTSERFTVHPYGMAEFLARLLGDEFDEPPVSLVFWDGAPARFVHWREEQRRYLAGLDPVTGEPDPYAGPGPG